MNFNLNWIRSSCLALPLTYEKLSHGSPSWFVEKGKQFAIYAPHHHGNPHIAAWILATPEAQSMLISSIPNRYFVPPFVGVRGWVAAILDEETDWDEVAGLLEEAHKLAQPKRRTARS